MKLVVDAHPLLDLAAFETEFLTPLGECPSPDWLVALLRENAPAPVVRSEEARAAIRDMMRHGSYKPTGRGKPASEYLVRAAAEADGLRSINAAVDACNVVSLHTGVPISVVDLDRARSPLRVALAPDGAAYVCNPSGQEIRVAGLVCLHDAEGPCANGVKDSQRTKTADDTRRTLSVLWSARALDGIAARAAAWYRVLLERAGARTLDVEISAG